MFCVETKRKFEKNDQKFPFRGLIGYENSCMDWFFFCKNKTLQIPYISKWCSWIYEFY